MRKLISLLVLCLSLSSMVFGLCRSSTELLVLHQLWQTMRSNGAAVEEIRISAWTIDPESSQTQTSLRSSVDRMAFLAGLPLYEGVYTEESLPGYERVSLQYTEKAKTYLITAQTAAKRASERTSGVYVQVAVTFNGIALGNIPAIYLDTLQFITLMKGFDSFPHINTCLVGRLDGKLVKEDGKACLERAFTNACAEIVDYTEGNQFFCGTGYVNGVPAYGNKQHTMNLHMAVRYSAIYGHTYLIAGSPLINMDY